MDNLYGKEWDREIVVASDFFESHKNVDITFCDIYEYGDKHNYENEISSLKDNEDGTITVIRGFPRKKKEIIKDTFRLEIFS